MAVRVFRNLLRRYYPHFAGKLEDAENSIYIPFSEYFGVSGMVTFLNNLKAYLDKSNFQYKRYFPNTKHIFFPVQYPIDALEKIKRKKGIIIQRLDGIWYPQKHPDTYEKLNKIPRLIYQKYADFVVFQSDYSLQQVSALYGKKPDHQHKIIVNGVNKQIFYPSSQKKEVLEYPVKFITTGGFRNLDMLEPVIKALDEITDFSFEFSVVGPIQHEGLKAYMNRPYINHYHVLPANEIAEMLRSHDIFIYSHLNPPCPNSVLEAVSVGMPVVGFNSGAMEELCFFNVDLLAKVSSDIFQSYEQFDYKRLKNKIEQTIEHFNQYKQRSLKYTHLYDFEKCGAAYINVFRKLLPNQ